MIFFLFISSKPLAILHAFNYAALFWHWEIKLENLVTVSAEVTTDNIAWTEVMRKQTIYL